ncbi:hypothetical protein CHS0354_018574 [Potamilus streckersoni]|uniref:tRNA (guanine(10)-N(2))-methyltransferase TRMT11 n=1 Tax=Potamilus streckersoni TaxID=2493646 RepID=A0AAE0TBI2_9BIVA|nr:hypothetical protein CHS0354_018574 [Potamilus streckersoni]
MFNPASNVHAFFVTCPRLTENILASELDGLGIPEIIPQKSGVSFRGTLGDAYRVCLMSRIAGRVLLELASFPVSGKEDFYGHINQIDWENHITPDDTIAVDAVTAHTVLHHSHFVEMFTKDAVADRFNRIFGRRPSVSINKPTLRININLRRNAGSVSIDLSGDSLHKRNYRENSIGATLKENLAAAVLSSFDWMPALQKRRGKFVDFMCGTGTFLLEAAMAYHGVAPSVCRSYFGFLNWKYHDREAYQSVISQLGGNSGDAQTSGKQFFGFEKNAALLKNAHQATENLELEDHIHFEVKDYRELPPAFFLQHSGVIFLNPPYGIRLGDEETSLTEYQEIYRFFQLYCRQWQTVVLCPAAHPFIRSRRFDGMLPFYNGAIEIYALFHDFSIRADKISVPADTKSDMPSAPDKDLTEITETPRTATDHSDTAQATETDNAKHQNPDTAYKEIPELLSSASEQLINRVRKNIKALRRYLKQNRVTCYRIYDRDIPEFAFSADIYEQRLLISEYQAPAEIDPQKAEERLQLAVDTLSKELKISPHLVYVKQRRRQKGHTQYSKLSKSDDFFTVSESGLHFRVNLRDYLDTGLFTDHRIVRDYIRQKAAASATVYALNGKAMKTVSVDTSPTYLKWGEENLHINGYSLGRNHSLVKADCFEFLEEEQEKFDLIFMAPPIFSNNRSEEREFSTEDDHVRLIGLAMKRLTPEGELIFSTPLKNFRPDEQIMNNYTVRNLSKTMLPPDCVRSASAFHVFLITPATKF